MSVPNVPSVPEGGNTKTPSSKDNPKIKYCFTLNNYTEEEYCSIRSMFTEFGAVSIIGKEVGEEGTPHLQAFCRLKSKKRFSWIKKMIPRAHIEASRGSDKDNLMYCSKEGNYWSLPRWKPPRELAKVSYDILRPQQKKIADLFMDYEDALFGRQINWFWEHKGGWGKTILTKYFLDSHKLNCVTIASKTGDAFHQIAKYIEVNGEGPDIVICDIPRCSLEYINYQAIEKIKDGCFSSGKYEGCEVRMNAPHIICFANEPPDKEKLSLDRWNIINCIDI